jgi:uncharacterized sulfatase
MRGSKGMLSEGGIRVPFVAAWPGRIPGGQVFDHPVISLDIAATAVAGAGLPQPAELDGINLLPFLTGEKDGAPHETLFWRWVDQAAIQEFPYKLILAGEQPPLLFDVTTPEGEDRERNLVQDKPEIASRLQKKLEAWMSGLKPPGPPESLAPHRLDNFVRYGLLPEPANTGTPRKSAKSARPEPEGSVQGWICRNGTLAERDGALRVTREPAGEGGNAKRAFLSRTGLDLPGPVAATLRLRAKKGGPSTLTWRTRSAQFTPEQLVKFDWPASAEFREVTLDLAEKERIIHIRITPAVTAEGLEVRSVTLTGRGGSVEKWDFSQP